LSLLLVTHGTYASFPEALRQAAFHVVSGHHHGLFATDYALWPAFAPVLLMFLGCFVSCAGSTGGGIKMVRMLMLVKQARASWCASSTRAWSTRSPWAGATSRPA
jgi:trk system potassium uptake protein TrkH